jgi:DNA-binding SARP family transcriptional activator
MAYLDMIDHAPLPELRVRMLGPLLVSVAGRDVRFTRKASRSTLEMLLLEYPRPVHEERLSEALWPDATPAAAKRSLQTAVNDLRKSLDPFQRPNGPSYVRFRDEHYVLELPDRSSVDYHTFRDATPDLTARVQSGGRAEDREALRRALELYRGELLEHAPYAEHVIERREQARSVLLDGIAVLAGAITTSSPALAIRLLERGLEADPYWAEGLAMLMECLRSQNRTLAALRLFRQYEQRLEKDLGVAPDPRLREVFEQLTRS